MLSFNRVAKAESWTRKGQWSAVMIFFMLTFFLLAGLAYGESEPAGGDAKAGKAQVAEPGLLELKDFLDIALRQNPSLKAARRHWKMKEYRPARVRSLEDPVLKYTEAAREVETRLGPVDRTFSLNQKLPFPGKLRLKGSIAEKEAEIARVAYEKILRDLTAEVRKTYYELYFVDMAVDLQEENEAVLDYFAEISRRNYGLDVSELDELVRAQRSSAKATFSLYKAKDMRETVVARLNALLDRAPDTEVGRLSEPDFIELHTPVNEMYEMAAKNNEMVRMAGLRVEKSELEKRLAGFAYKPNFSVGVNYAQIGLPPSVVKDGGSDALSFSVGVSLPLWLGKNRAGVAEKRELINKSRFDKRATLVQVKSLVDKVYYSMSTAKSIAQIYKKRFIPEAKDSMDFAEARYKTGKESLGRLLETQSMWIDFRLLYYRAFTDYLKDIAELERLTASELIK